MRSILLALVVLLILPGLALPAVASHWSHTAGLSPDSVPQAAATVFTFTVANTASGTLDVYSVWIHFCWEQSNLGYSFKRDDGNNVSIPGGASHDFTGFIRVNATTLGNCPWEAQVRGKAVGDLSAYTAIYRGSINVYSRSSIVAGRSANLISLIALIAGVVVIVIIVLVLLVVLLSRSGAPNIPPLQPSGQPQWPPGTPRPPAQPPLAPGQAPSPAAPAYCTNCGAPLARGSVFCGACGARVG